MHFAIPQMIAQGGGSIINISSGAGVKPTRMVGPYCGAKAAFIAMTKVAALEYAGHGVRINAVLPGAIETPLFKEFIGKNSDVRETIISQHPVGRFGSPDELAGLVAYLASDEASFINGSAYACDGGFTAS